MHDLAGVNAGRGIEQFDKTGAQLIDVRISRHEAEVLSRYWFERNSFVVDFRLAYGQTSLKEGMEADATSCRLTELEPHVTESFRAELRAEAERRDEEVRKAHDAYIAFLTRDAPTNDPGDLE
jgi:hypothetical protein